jgi:hypothetical protein
MKKIPIYLGKRKIEKKDYKLTLKCHEQNEQFC